MWKVILEKPRKDSYGQDMLSQGQIGSLVISLRTKLQLLVLIIGWGGMSGGVYVRGTALVNSDTCSGIMGPCSTREGTEQSPCLCSNLVVVDNTAGITGHCCKCGVRCHREVFIFHYLCSNDYISHLL